MPFTLINTVIENDLKPGDSLRFPYPEGKSPRHYFGAIHHTLSFDANFYRSPAHLIAVTGRDDIEIIWQGPVTIPGQTLVNIQLEEPGGEFYVDPKYNVTIRNMVRSQMFLMSLGRPHASDLEYFYAPATIDAAGELTLKNNELQESVPRNVVIHAEGDVSACTFKVHGEDLYDQPITEHIPGPSEQGLAEGKKTFLRVHRIVATAPCGAAVKIGTGQALGLPAHLPGSGFVFRQMIDGRGIERGIIIPGYTDRPGPDTPDVRGTYTPPDDIELDGKKAIQILVSLFNPGNIGMRDYAERDETESADSDAA